MNPALISVLIFIVIIITFVSNKLPMATVAILGCVAMVVAGVCKFSVAFGSFASSTVILTIGVMIIGAAISETGLAGVIGKWVVVASNGSEFKLIVSTYLISAAMSAFLTNSAVLAVFIPIIMGLSQANKKLDSRDLLMPITYGCVIGGAMTLVGSTQQMTTQGLLVSAGMRTFKVFDFSLVGGVILLLGLVYVLLIGHRRGKNIWGSREPVEETAVVNSGTPSAEPNKSKMIIVMVIFIGAILFYITEWLPLAITSSAAALLCIVTGCISQKKAILSVDWNIVGRLAGCLGIANCLDAAGGTDLIATTFQHLLGHSLSPFMLFCILVFLALFCSEFISNSTAILIIIPILLSIAPAMDLNVYAYALGITIASGIPLSCPLASSTLGISMIGGYQFNDYFKYSIFMDIISYVAIVALVPFIYGLTI